MEGTVEARENFDKAALAKDEILTKYR